MKAMLGKCVVGQSVSILVLHVVLTVTLDRFANVATECVSKTIKFAVRMVVFVLSPFFILLEKIAVLRSKYKKYLDFLYIHYTGVVSWALFLLCRKALYKSLNDASIATDHIS